MKPTKTNLIARQGSSGYKPDPLDVGKRVGPLHGIVHKEEVNVQKAHNVRIAHLNRSHKSSLRLKLV